jgi:hypothetical protein
MRGSAGNEVGAMGELVAMRYLDLIGVRYLDEREVNHDLRVGHVTVDVKTKERSVTPKPDYDCTAPDYNKEAQLPDWYLFVSLLSDKSKGTQRFRRGWVLGSMLRVEFREQATLWEPGMRDTSNNWDPTIACWNVPVSALKPPKTVTV